MPIRVKGAFGLRLLIQSQDVISDDVEPLFDDLAEQRITLGFGKGRNDLAPVLRLQNGVLTRANRANTG